MNVSDDCLDCVTKLAYVLGFQRWDLPCLWVMLAHIFLPCPTKIAECLTIVDQQSPLLKAGEGLCQETRISFWRAEIRSAPEEMERKKTYEVNLT